VYLELTPVRCRDVDGSKVHQAIREPYTSAYVEGDVIGFYINLPNGAEYAPKYELYVNKATRAVFPVPLEKEEGPPKRVPGIFIMTYTSLFLTPKLSLESEGFVTLTCL
jgi:hypothetical protein